MIPVFVRMLTEVFSISFLSFQSACLGPDVWRRNCNTTCSCGLLYFWWLTSTQDVPTELLKGFFCSEVDRLFPCSLFVLSVCEREREREGEFLCAVNKICFCPQTMTNRALLLVCDGYKHFFLLLFPRVIEYGGLSWQLVRWCSLWFFSSFFLVKERSRMQMDPPPLHHYPNSTKKSRSLCLLRELNEQNLQRSTST